MNDESSRRAPEHDSDYDGAWKEALRRYLAEFMAKYFPSEYAAIDWSYEPEWCDKELSQVVSQAGRRNSELDLLVMMHLRPDLEERFERDLADFEEQRQMPYVTSVERIAEARGEARGRANVVLAQLAEVCGGVPEEYEHRLRELPSRELEKLAQALLRFQSLADLQTWLDEHSLR